MEPRYKEAPKTVAEMVAWYDKNFTRAAEKARAMSGEQLLRNIDFYGIFNFPAFMYLSFVNNHSRPMGSKVPCIYGPSADEEWKAA
jgi:hypothetical protein